MTDDPRCSKDFQWLESRIVEHRWIAKDTWELTLEAPNLARWTLPGQFFMVRLAGLNDPLIGRALAMFDRGFDSQGNPQTVSVAYVVKGKFTHALSRFKAGQSVEIWGPLGNAFSNHPVDHLILVAGGVGITPMLSLAPMAKRATLPNKSPSAMGLGPKSTSSHSMPLRQEGFDWQSPLRTARSGIVDGSPRFSWTS
jgi:NAD(P)H-flavin reductase